MYPQLELRTVISLSKRILGDLGRLRDTVLVSLHLGFITKVELMERGPYAKQKICCCDGSFYVNPTASRNAQISGKTLCLCVSVRVLLEKKNSI